jgi:N-acetylmuramoyl-L-alanine amidase
MSRWALAGVAAIGPLDMFGSPVRAEDPFSMGIRGQNLIAAKKYREAIAVLEQAVSQDPGSDWFHGLLGRAYHGAGLNAKAIRSFREAVKINPDDTYSRMMIEIISLKPVEKEKVEKPLSPLEKRALQEEKEMMRKLHNRSDALSFEVERIVLDPGHGGFDSGAVGKGGLKEKDVTLALTKRLSDKLKKKSRFQVFTTREADYYVPLGERTATANQRRADLFVSFHINAAENRKAHGSETYYCSEKASNREAARLAAFENSVLRFDEEAAKKTGFLDIEAILFEFERKLYWEDSKRFAHKFQGRFGTQLDLRDRGVQFANFFVLRRAKMPSLLLETGFISNAREEKLLREEQFREKIVDAAYGAILEMSGA